MKNSLLLYFLVILIASCGGSKSDDLKDKEVDILYYDGQAKFHIPKKVKVNEKAVDLFQFPGTRIFIQKPERFDYVPDNQRLQKGDNIYVTAFEYEGASFQEHKYNTIQQFKTAEYTNTIYFEQDVKIGKHEGYFVCGLGSRPNYLQLMVLFGDETFSALVLAEVEYSNSVTINDITKSLLTSFVNPNAEPDYSAFKTYDVDFSKSNFQLVKFVNGAFLYSTDPNADLSNNLMTDFLSLYSKSTKMSESEAHSVFDATINQIKANGLKVNNISYEDITFKKFDGYQMKANAVGKEGSIEVFSYVLNDRQGVIVFSGLMRAGAPVIKKDLEQVLYSIKRL